MFLNVTDVYKGIRLSPISTKRAQDFSLLGSLFTIPSVPIVDQNTLYFTGDGVYAVNALDGALRWHGSLGPTPSKPGWVCASRS